MQKQSKLMMQLQKEKKLQHRSPFNEELIEETYNTICKLDPKNLMLVEFLSLIIERDFVRNSNKLADFAHIFEEYRQDYDENDNTVTATPIDGEDRKFSKKKFIRMLKELSKRLYPGYQNAYQTIIYQKLTRIDFDQMKIKVDDSLKKILNKETLNTISEFDHELQTVFEIYMPQNFNNKLDFRWEEIRVLEKKIPVISCLKFLYEAELVPQNISPSHFLQIITKMKPPLLPNSGNSKEAMFYTSETMNSYLRDSVHLPQIKLLEGDGGLTFFEFQVMFIKLATQFVKDSKSQISGNFRKLVNHIKLKEAFDESAPRKSKFMQTVKQHLKSHCAKSEKIVVKKRQSRKNIEDLYDAKDIEMEEQQSKNIYRNMSVDRKDLQIIRKDLDIELGELTSKKKVDKENSGYFDVQKKHVVIGQQLPKIQEKTKAAVSKDPKKKNEDPLMGYKAETEQLVKESDIGKLIHRPKKLRLNIEYPIILNQVFYPSDLKSQLFISPKAQIYLETSYIHLGERMYQESFAHYSKARVNTESKSPLTEFYYNIHVAQIFQSAGRDEVSLSFYHKAKELLSVLSSLEGSVKSHPYVGMGVCLYHMEEHQYALRCFQKAKTVYGLSLEVQSIDHAILQNNIGCCMMMLSRNQEAIKYFEMSHHILDLKAGCFDERTLVVQQNFNKNRKTYLELLPEFRTMWKTYAEKSTTKLPVVKAAGGVKKKK